MQRCCGLLLLSVLLLVTVAECTTILGVIMDDVRLFPRLDEWRDEQLVMRAERHRRTSPSACQVNETARQDYGRYASQTNSTNPLSVLQPPRTLEHLRQQQQYQTEIQDVQMNTDQPSTAASPHGTVLYGQRHCPNRPIVSGNDQPLMETALCPWFWRINYDRFRIPNAVPEAHCRCGSAVTGHRLFTCEEVTMQLRVLRLDRECNEYRPDVLDLAVSCVSVLQPQQNLQDIDGVSVQQEPTVASNEY